MSSSGSRMVSKPEEEETDASRRWRPQNLFEGGEHIVLSRSGRVRGAGTEIGYSTYDEDWDRTKESEESQNEEDSKTESERKSEEQERNEETKIKKKGKTSSVNENVPVPKRRLRPRGKRERKVTSILAKRSARTPQIFTPSTTQNDTGVILGDEDEHEEL